MNYSFSMVSFILTFVAVSQLFFSCSAAGFAPVSSETSGVKLQLQSEVKQATSENGEVLSVRPAMKQALQSVGISPSVAPPQQAIVTSSTLGRVRAENMAFHHECQQCCSNSSGRSRCPHCWVSKRALSERRGCHIGALLGTSFIPSSCFFAHCTNAVSQLPFRAGCRCTRRGRGRGGGRGLAA